MTSTVSTSLRYEGEPVKGSRFIVDVAPSGSENEARALVDAAANDFADASHHCSAWRLASPLIERANDDGEPSGSAGRPILAQLVGRDLVDTAIVVTRYFGGTKLGVGGLVRAYGGAAATALDVVAIEPWLAMAELTFEHSYAATDAIERALAEAGGTAVERTFGAEVAQHVRLPITAFTAFSTAVADATAGNTILALPDL